MIANKDRCNDQIVSVTDTNAMMANNNSDTKIAFVKLSTNLSLYMRTFINITIFDTNNTSNINDISSESRMGLHSHASMSVVGQHAYICLTLVKLRM